MIKIASPAQRHPTNRATLEAFHRYWGESHGPLFTNTRRLRGYVQHLTLAESYGRDPKPTFDGVSVFFYDDLESRRAAPEGELGLELRRAVHDDDAQLFDRIPAWPTHHKRASVVADEIVLLEGETRPDMVKAVILVGKKPGLTLAQFFAHLEREHGQLALELPGLRRYVQNHAIPAAYADLGQTHDAFSELWFDDLDSLWAAAASPQWAALQADGETLFGENSGVVVARERVQKDPRSQWTYRDWGVGELDEDAIREKLAKQGFRDLAADPAVPAKLKTAAGREALAVWTDEHIVTLDDSRIDARPERS